MNAFAIIILLTIALGYLLDLISNVLNLKALSPELPREFESIYDADKYRRSQEYARARTRFGFVANTYSLAIVLAFWFLGGCPFVDQWLREFEFGEILTGLLFILVLTLWSTFSLVIFL